MSVMNTTSCVQDDQRAEVLRSVMDHVREHPLEDRKLFERMVSIALTAEDPDDRHDAVQTMLEIIRDNGDSTAEVATLMLPNVDSTEKPANRKLRAWTEYVAAKIRKLREQRGWTQTQLAEEAGLTQSHVCRIENAVHSPSWKTITRIAKALGVAHGDIDPVD